jgi:hypothetical protein
MAFEYTWAAAVDFVKSYTRNIPMDKVGVMQCDAVSAEMWEAYPWHDACQAFAPQLLVDNVQDYSSPPSFYKLTNAQIIRVAPDEFSYESLDVTRDLPETTQKVHPSQITAIGWQRGGGLIRLNYRPDLSANTESFELRGEYQLVHPRVSDLDQRCWFSDMLWHVALEGVLYWGYKLGDRKSMAEDQYKLFRAKIDNSWIKESQGASDFLVPTVNIGGW